MDSDYPFGIFKLLFYIHRLILRWKVIFLDKLEKGDVFAYTRGIEIICNEMNMASI
jgi:hypothetical protein